MKKKELEALERDEVDELLEEALIPEQRLLIAAQQYLAAANDVLRLKELLRVYKRLGRAEQAKALEEQLAEALLRLELLEGRYPGVKGTARDYQVHIHRHGTAREPGCRYCLLAL